MYVKISKQKNPVAYLGIRKFGDRDAEGVEGCGV